MRAINADAMKADLLTVDPQYETVIEWCIRVLDAQPTIEPEREKGKWLEPSVSSEGIEEWQSCKCSICGRYTTRPYLYYFDYPKFCSGCGNPMEGRE